MKGRKETLKNIILNGELVYDTTVYRLINSNCLDKIISKIDNISVVSNVNSKNMISSSEQFIELLNRFVVCFKNTFPSIANNSEHIIEVIIKSNIDRVEKYLLSKYYMGDNQYTKNIYKNIYKIIINNFIKNSKYIFLMRNLIKNSKIKLKNIDEYSFDEICKIKDLMSSIVFCSHDKYITIYLFYNINYEIKRGISKMDRYIEDKNNYKFKIIENFKEQYRFMIDDYIKKRRYLKYFK